MFVFVSMKTNVTMIRKMGDFDVQQRTKDGMFNATNLAKQWNVQKSKGRKDISNFLNNSSTKEFISALSSETNTETRNLVTAVKGGNDKDNQLTWMHPYLFIKFAMWLNPNFEVKVIKFIHDQLIKSRHEAGDGYLQLSSSGEKLKGYNYAEIATAMQWIVYGKKGKDLRQTATENQLNELKDLQTKLSFAIDMGYIKTYPQLINELRKIWNDKNNKF